MSQLAIKFDHIYWKMPPAEMMLQNRTKLLQVFPISFEDMSPDFIQYDTAIKGGGNYELKPGNYLMLFLTTGRYTWTTLRKFNQENYDYYTKNLGRFFKIEISIKG